MAVWKLAVLAPLSAGSVVHGRFRLDREGEESIEFNVQVPPDATSQQIGQIAIQRAKELVEAQPAPVLLTLQQLASSNTVWSYDPKPPQSTPPQPANPAAGQAAA
ncbi:MAG: hypothetical protein V4719_20440 [Planctomycetota bacterium]